MKSQLLTGARALISYTDSKGVTYPLALAIDMNVSVANSVRMTYVMGSLNAANSDPVGMDVSCSIGMVVPINTPIDSNQSQASSAISLGLEPKINEAIMSEALTIAITDKSTGKIIASVKGARFTGRSMSMGAQDAASSRLNFIGVLDAGYGGDENGGAQLGYSPTVA